MKTLRSIIIAVITGAAISASADTYSFNFTNNFANGGVIPDGNLTGWSVTRALSGITDLAITDVNVSLNISGGFNGDLYAYLAHDSGFSVLLNRPGRPDGFGFGYGDAGLNITLDDAAALGDIHTYQTMAGYATLISNGSGWSPDGRNVNPLTVLGTDSRLNLLDQFHGLNPNGDWTLFVADVSTGAEATLVSWGLSITAVPVVPEPSCLALGILGALALCCRRADKH
ncbi:MAG: PEP-CTERM sorting domain-containing protein [Verrucomicrobiota bacterium]